jgi:hypothetical protein
MMERSQRSAGLPPDTRDAVIAAAESIGEITFEWNGRHLVRKPSGKGGMAGYFRSMEITQPAEFQALVRRTFHYALDSDNVGALYQALTDPDVIQPTLYEFCATWFKGKIVSRSRAPSLPKAKAKRLLKEWLNNLERGPASVDLRNWSV